MTRPAIELAACRAQTAEFISANVVTLSLDRYEPLGSGDDREVTYISTRSSQQFRLIDSPRFASRSAGSEPDSPESENGEQHVLAFVLLGEYDAEFGVDDRFALDGFEYVIREVLPDNGYERRAIVYRYGEGA